MAGKIRLSAVQVAEKHGRRLKGSIEDIRTGIQSVTESPTAKAAKKADKYLQGVQAAVSSGRWANRLNSVTLEDWKKAAIDKGLGRIAAGVDNAMPKTTAFFDQLLPFEASLQDQVAKLPDLTLQDSIERAAAWMRGMNKFVRK
jgi:hypothetical protein